MQERAELHKTIWSIANDLRGSVDGWEFKSAVYNKFPTHQTEDGQTQIDVSLRQFLLVP